MQRKRSLSQLTLGEVTFGDRKPDQAFAAALSPYFAKVEVEPLQAERETQKRSEREQAMNRRR